MLALHQEDSVTQEQERRAKELEIAALNMVASELEFRRLQSELESLQVRVTKAKTEVLLAAAHHKDLVAALIKEKA